MTPSLTVVVTLLAMAGHRLGLMAGDVQSWVEFGLGTPVVPWAGWLLCMRGVASIIHLSPNMGALIGLGTGAAYL